MSKEKTLKEISGLVDQTPIFSEELLSFLSQAAEYYLHPVGEVLAAAAPPFPPGLLRKIKKKDFDPQEPLFRAAQFLDDEAADLVVKAKAALYELSGAQSQALAQIVGSIQERRAERFLLHGVTGSGKTEVYIRAAQKSLELGLGVIVLVPEIALTPQLIGLFEERLGHAFAVLHSAQTYKQRLRAWLNLREGRARLALGARSALFAPVQDLGLVIVDEEHDGSFKQEEGFRYQARDMALLRAYRSKASCVLSSATPSLESYSLACSDKLKLLTLPERVTEHSLPSVEIVDLRKHRTGPSGLRWLSAPLHRAIDQALSEGNQAILFLNRRGYSPSLLCAGCGEFVRCPACSVTLTEHRKRGLMCCHYCNFSREVPVRCPSCSASALLGVGLGTEQIEAMVKEHWPTARILRLDRDTASSDRGQSVIESFRKGEADILVGTQMVSKGHDIGKVTVVGVIYADHSLSLPDFRAAERVFQLLAQVSGRAGRGEHPGRVFVQTFQPELPLMRAVAAHDYETYVRNELRTRQELGYPPYSRMVAVRVNAVDERRAAKVAAMLTERARANAPASVRLLGPAPAPIFRLRGRYRFRFLMIAQSRHDLRVPLSAVIDDIERGIAPVRASVDVDPYSML